MSGKPPPETPTPRRTRGQEQRQQQNQTPQAPGSRELVLASGLQALQITSGTNALDMSMIQNSEELRRFCMPPSDQTAVQRLTTLFDELNRHQQRNDHLMSIVEGTFADDDRFNKLLNKHSQLQALFKPVRVSAKRHRDTQTLMEGAIRATRNELGDAFMDMYQSNMGDNKAQWDAIRRLCKLARDHDINFLSAWRIAWSEALKRIKNPARYEGGTKDAVITDQDLPHPGVNMPTTLDQNRIPWLSGPPSKRLTDTNQPLPAPRPWKETKAGGKRHATPPPPGSSEKIEKPKKPHPADSPGLFGDPDNDPFMGESTAKRNVRIVFKADPKTGKQVKEEQLVLEGTPSRSIRHLASGWKPGTPVIVPIVPVNRPQYGDMLTDKRLSPLQRALIQYHYQYTLFLTGQRQSVPDPMAAPLLRNSAPTDIRMAATSLRRLIDYHAPEATRSNPYNARENQRFWWICGLCQWLAGIAFWDFIQDPSWIRETRALLQTIRQAWPVDPAATGSDARLQLTNTVAIQRTSFSDDEWLIDSSGRFLGWANDDTIYAALGYMARQHPQVDIISPAHFTAYRNRVLLTDRYSTIEAPTLHPEAQQVLIPINLNNNHWVLGFIDHQTHRIGILDSMNSTTNPEILRNLLVENGYNPDDYHDYTGPPSVYQANSSDCGFWVIANARALVETGIPARDISTGELRFGILWDLYRGIRDWNARNPYARDRAALPPQRRHALKIENTFRALDYYPSFLYAVQKHINEKPHGTAVMDVTNVEEGKIEKLNVQTVSNHLRDALDHLQKARDEGRAANVVSFKYAKSVKTADELKKIEAEQKARLEKMRKIEEEGPDSPLSSISDFLGDVNEKYYKGGFGSGGKGSGGKGSK